MSAPTVEEQVVWQGSPSQWLGFGTYFVSALAAILIAAALIWVTSYPPPALTGSVGVVQVALGLLLLVPAFVTLRQYLTVRMTVYTVTSQRIRVTRGVFSRRTDDLELYRVDDIILDEPLLLRLVRRGNLTANSSDRTTPLLTLNAVPQAMELRDRTRHFVEICRDRKRTRVLDME